MEIRNLQIEYSRASTGGSISVENANNISFFNCSLSKSKSESKAAAIFVNSIKRFIMKNIAIQDNINFNGNGVILIQNDDESALISVKNLSCTNNIALIGACLYYFSSTPLMLDVLTIQNCVDYAIYTSWSYKVSLSIFNVSISNIQSEYDIISITDGQVDFNNWQIKENNIEQSLISLTEANGVISRIDAIYNQGLQVFNFLLSNLTILDLNAYNPPNLSMKIGVCSGIMTDLIFENGTISNSESYNFAVASFFQGNIFLKNITFQGSKGQVLEIRLGNLIANNCYFLNNTCFSKTKSNDIIFSNTETLPYNITINNSYFEIINHHSLDFQGLINIVIINSGFYNLNLDEDTNIFAIYAFDFCELTINSSKFSGFTDSAVQLFTDYLNMHVSKNRAIIHDSFFSLNKARLGSSFYISGTFDLLFNGCTFYKNYAYISDKNTLSGMAPAIFFKPFNIIKSKIAILSCNFINNTAEYIAPTVFSQKGVFVNRFNTYKDNVFLSKCNFTDKIFAVPGYIKPIVYETEEGINLFNPLNPIINVVSGRSFNLTLKIMDFFGHPLTFDNSTLVVIKGQNIALENNLMIAKEGNISFQNLIIKTNSKSSFVLSFESTIRKI